MNKPFMLILLLALSSSALCNINKQQPVKLDSMMKILNNLNPKVKAQSMRSLKTSVAIKKTKTVNQSKVAAPKAVVKAPVKISPKVGVKAASKVVVKAPPKVSVKAPANVAAKAPVNVAVKAASPKASSKQLIKKAKAKKSDIKKKQSL